MGSYLGDMLRVLELAVLYYDTSSPLIEGARQRRRVDPRSGVKAYVRLSVFLERHPDRSGGSFFVWRRLRRLFRRGYSRIVSLPLEGKVPRRGG